MTALQEVRPSRRKPSATNWWPGILFAFVLHIAGIYALTTASPHSTVALLHERTEAVVVIELPKNYLPPPPQPPEFKPPPLVPVLPEVEINLSKTPPPATTPSSPAAMPDAPTEILSTPPVPITSHAVTSDDYPPLSLRLAEEGLVKIKYLVQTDGTVGECAVILSSGSSRLDDAACTMVQSRWRFTPATQQGMPVVAYLLAEVSFKLVPSSDN